MGQSKEPKTKLREVYRHSSYHRAELLASEICGCFYCLKTFSPAAIQRWIDGDASVEPGVEDAGQTAICPLCGIDSVIGSASGFAITPDLLDRMHRTYFTPIG